MKLRNKKTGKIQTCDMVVITDEPIDGEEIARLNRDTFVFPGIEQFNDEYETYKPKESLIKDEKIRKAVKAWAEANGIERVWHEYASCWLRGNGLSIEMENEVDELEQGNYTIAELCGEEE